MSGFNLSALAVRERAVTLFVLIIVVVAGALSFLNLGRAEDPTFTVKVLTVTAAWPGATAQEMQDLVAEPLESASRSWNITTGWRPSPGPVSPSSR